MQVESVHRKNLNMIQTASYGAWASPITADLIAAGGAVRLSDKWYWRPEKSMAAVSFCFDRFVCRSNRIRVSIDLMTYAEAADEQRD